MVEVTRDLTRSAAGVGRDVGNRDFTVRSAVNGVWQLTFAGLLTSAEGDGNAHAEGVRAH